jgi:hypothetical protein
MLALDARNFTVAFSIVLAACQDATGFIWTGTGDVINFSDHEHTHLLSRIRIFGSLFAL